MSVDAPTLRSTFLSVNGTKDSIIAVSRFLMMKKAHARECVEVRSAPRLLARHLRHSHSAAHASRAISMRFSGVVICDRASRRAAAAMSALRRQRCHPERQAQAGAVRCAVCPSAPRPSGTPPRRGIEPDPRPCESRVGCVERPPGVLGARRKRAASGGGWGAGPRECCTRAAASRWGFSGIRWQANIEANIAASTNATTSIGV